MEKGTGFIQCYLQKKLSHSEALELLSSKNMSTKNDNERIIFAEDPSQDLAVISQPPSSFSAIPKQIQNNSITPSVSVTVSPLQNGIQGDDYSNLNSEYTKLKMDHSKLKSEHEKLKYNFDTFKEETEHRLQQLFLAVTRREGSVEDLMVSNFPIFFETGRTRKSFPLLITFYDQPVRMVDLAEVMQNSPKCKDGITTSKEIADLFKDILWKIFGRDNIHHYTAASSRVKKGLTPISPDVIEAIRTLIYEGFRIDKNSKDSNQPDAGQHKRNEIDRVIKSTSSYLL
uniref:BEN domain-containing protein n=1 Tax=Panagrolaimus superbus TaxID=310955 RepID=A0A914YR89_9BILA